MNVYEINTLVKPAEKGYRNYAVLRAQKSDWKFLGDPLEEFAGKPFSKRWRKVVLYNEKPTYPIGDFYSYRPGAFVCNESARALLAEPMEMSGEILPVKIERDPGKYYIYNCTNCLNAVDYKRSKWEQLITVRVLRMPPVFIPERLSEQCVFKISEDGFSRIFCIERTGLADDGEFKAIVEKNNLKGIGFNLVWSDKKTEKEIKEKPECRND
jgi:hypothetical protein